VVEGARLESVFAGNRNEGSNPSPSANQPALLLILLRNRVTHSALPIVAFSVIRTMASSDPRRSL
jgi:hypothetical protein